MNKFVFWLSLWIGILFVSPVLAADVYTIEPDHSSYIFSVKAAVVSTVFGGFSSSSGTITYDPDDLSSFDAKVTIKAVGIDTFNQTRDQHLKSQDFFDVPNFPEITFVSKTLDSQHILVGDLTIHGVTHEVSIPVSITGPVVFPDNIGTAIGISGQLTINRSDYGMSWNRSEGKLSLLGDDVQISINIIAIKK